ncbi:reverse transcriptase [Plakobranchus ocellatus]|uniref:Reverse transcriptase n=1 Tax=Plakobranchus ocellatus TaxID=259542 RepID=A0AAV3ZCW1_9GAST|nr:reverse transcriptase [Plakobranchus ocellatus]
MIWEAIQRAKLGKRNLDVVWLHLANAYSSASRQMIQQTLRMYHIPEDMQMMLEGHFSGFNMRFSTESMGLRFAMEVIMRAAEGTVSPADLSGGCYMLALKAFIGDIYDPVLKGKRDPQNASLVRCSNELEQNEFQNQRSLEACP